MRPDLAVVIQLVIASIVQAYNDGDVQLIGGDDNPTFEGVLQVYLQGKWNTVCYDNVNEAAATVVCRQLGYINYTNIYPGYNGDSSPSVITDIHCPVVMTSTEAEIPNILRCDVAIGSAVSKSCYRFAMTCDKTKYFYNGQVRIHHKKLNGNNYALLEINLEEDWRPICISNSDMNSFVADSACRQMGYTNANSSNPSGKFNKKSWKIDIHSRCSMGIRSSSPCFTDCINHYTAVDNCADDDENMYDLPCFFNMSVQKLFSSGTENLCRYSSESIDVRFYSVTGVLSFVVFVLMIVVIVQFCRHRCHRRQPPAAGPAAQPNIVVRWWKNRGEGYGAVHEQRED